MRCKAKKPIGTIPINLNLLRRVAEKPPRILLWKSWQLALKHVRSFGYWQNLSDRLNRQISEIPDATLRQSLTDAPKLIGPAEGGALTPWLTEHVEEVQRG